MWERLQRFRDLDSEARGIFFRAAALLAVISWSLRFRGFRATQAALQNFSVPSKTEKLIDERRASGERAALAARMVNAAARYSPGRATCLEKSLALWWLLRREGMASSVRIGARKTLGKFEAHAWVEREGVVLNEPADAHRHYATFDAAFPLHSSETL